MRGWSTYPAHLYAFDKSSYPPTPFERYAATFVQAGARVIDIGCGNGRFSALALDYAARLVVAFDPRDDAKEAALRDFATLRAAKQDDCFQFHVESWPAGAQHLKGEPFDLIFSQSSLHYLDSDARREAFRAVLKHLRPHGRFALAVKSVDNAWLTSKDARLLRDGRWQCGDGFDRTFFTAHGLLGELQQAGFAAFPRDITARVIEGYEWSGELTVWLEAVVSAPRD